jgi:hypothetical protein
MPYRKALDPSTSEQTVMTYSDGSDHESHHRVPQPQPFSRTGEEEDS